MPKIKGRSQLCDCIGQKNHQDLAVSFSYVRKKADLVRFHSMSLLNPKEKARLETDEISSRTSSAMTDKLKRLIYTSKVYLSFIPLSGTAWHIVSIQYIFEIVFRNHESG